MSGSSRTWLCGRSGVGHVSSWLWYPSLRTAQSQQIKDAGHARKVTSSNTVTFKQGCLRPRRHPRAGFIHPSVGVKPTEQEEKGLCNKEGELGGSFPKQCLPKQQNRGSFFFVFCRFRALPVPYGGSRARGQIRSELQLPACTTATAMPDPSCVCSLHHSSWQCRILNPLKRAID